MLRDSVNVELYTRHLSRLEAKARELSGTIKSFVSENGLPLIITYSSTGFLPASLTYWFTLVMFEDKYPIRADFPTVTYQLLVYRPQDPIVGYAPSVTASVINALRTATLLGNKMVVLTGEIQDPRLDQLLRNYRVVSAGSNVFETALIQAMSSFHAMADLSRDKLSRRGARLLEHSVEGFAPVAKDLVEKYVEIVEWIASRKKLSIISTEIMECGAQYTGEVLSTLGIEAVNQRPGSRPLHDAVLLISTTVEDLYLRELESDIKKTGIDVRELVFNTDPLEANVYLSLLAYYLYFLKKMLSGGVSEPASR